MSDWKKLESAFTSALKLSAAPVAVTFSAKAPEGVRKFLGSVPSSCSFWRVAQTAPAGKSAFFTEPSDHYNCPVGSYTHNVALPVERAHELDDVLGLMAKIGYLKMEEVPQIPRWSSAPKAIVYSHLADAPSTPDVVIFSLNANAAMLLGEATKAANASAGMEPLGRPTCMSLAAAEQKGGTMSLGCVGNRVYTELESGQVYMILRGRDLDAVAASLSAITNANEQLFAYHTGRKSSLLQLS